VSGLSFWPEQASSHASQVDWLVIGFSILILALSAPVFVLIVVFAVKYRRGRAADRSNPVNHRVGLEISWAVVPFLLLLFFYVWSTYLFYEVHHPPSNALDIQVVAKQWMWKFEHPGGQREIDELHVPAGQSVRLTMASQDVIHSLYIPALRLKQDVVPGRYTTLWFNADREGTYAIACAEFCGADHSLMGGHLFVLSPAAYGEWLEKSRSDQTLAAQGAVLFRNRGCSGCHGPASTVHAPPLEGLFGKPVPLANGRVVTATEQYIRDSILLPQSQIAAGYAPIMPTFQNVLSEEDVLKLVAYIKSLAADQPRRPR
jgi:cytochrome c oxidase subunit 2